MRSYNKLKIIMNFRGIGCWALLFSMVVAGSGCEQVDPREGYSSRSLYRTDIKSVYVQEFESESFRRGIEFELTRAIAQQLELHSPFKVISDRSKADSILYGSISRVSENILAQQRELDRPTTNEITIVTEVTWKDLRGSADLLLDGRKFHVSSHYSVMQGAGSDSAIQQAVNELAIRIVEAMEQNW